MQVVREVYLSLKQLRQIGVQEVSDQLNGDMEKRKKSAENAARRLYEKPYFPLYEQKDPGHPAAYYFPNKKVIIPAGLNELKKRIHEEWSHLGTGQPAVEYEPASGGAAARLHSYLSQFVKSDGTVTEPAFAFLSSVDYLLYRDGAAWKMYKMLCWHPAGFKGFSLPVWSCSLADGADFLDGWAELYQKYGLFPNVEEIVAWLQDLSQYRKTILTKEQYSKLKETWRRSDFMRLGSKYYQLSEGVFHDARCWETFEKAQPDNNKICCVFPDGEWLDARETAGNIVKGGLVSIDFGTKSTVVVISDKSTGSFYTLKSRKEHSEGNSLHPTVLKFCSLEKFAEAYESEAGRPDTCWETVSIDDSAHEGGSPDSALGIFRGLKQWMIDSRSNSTVLRQKDAPDKPIILNEYVSDENSIDPIELYAYYIGLYINNNQENRIFMRYRLSFSATCTEQIRNKMRESFRRGLTKSLPASIVNGSEMDNFVVDCTCSEPAAYAVCALACMGMPASCEDYFLYGIFDFGGGTCDFNYGIWGKGEDETLHKDKYKIWMLGDGGDAFLGGENLLELLAVQVFIEHREWFQEYRYKIARPRCYEGGDESFFSPSFEAANNLRCLVDQLRNPIWERPDDCDEKSKEFKIIIAGLIPEQKDGRYPADTELTLSREPLEKLLVKRIYEGVSAFFDTCCRTLEEHGRKDEQQLCVFLAGNSCRSKWVRRVFEKYINDDLDRSYVKAVYLCDPMGSPDFAMHIPADLWDGWQIQKMNENISRLGDLDGKTGVAYGLALYGDQVEIEDRSVKNYLLYYLGTSSFFDINVLRGAHGDRLVIGESVPFAASSMCNLYYTKMIPKGGTLSGTKAIMLNEHNISFGDNKICYVRAESQAEISIYAVSDDDPENSAPGDVFIVDLQSGQFRKATDTGKKG